MPKFILQIGAKEVLAEKLVKPGWYPTFIEAIDKQTAKDKESENFIIDVIGKEGDSNGVPCKCFFSEKFIQNINPFIRATGPLQGIPNPLSEESGLDKAYDLEKAQKCVVLAKWATNRGKDGQDKPRNSIEDWAPLPADHPLNSMNVGVGATTPKVGVGGFE